MLQASYQQEEKNKRKAMVVSLVVHALLLLLLIFIIAWKPQIPPPPEYGIELNFGMDATGSGDIESKAPASKEPSTEDSKPAPTAPETPVEPQPQQQPQQAVQQEKVVTTPVESPVTVKEVEKTKPTPEPKEEVKKPVERAMYPGKTDGTGSGKTGTSDKPAGSSEGDDKDAAGNKGDPRGVDKRGLYSGNPGGGGGSLNMPGWRFDNEPRPKDTSNESGKIVLKVKIDPDGQVETVDIIEYNVSYQVAKLYRDEVFRRATFERTNPATAGSQGATGYITYYITAR
ncbi:MAG: hypothetical protein LPJ89_09655 [Hymenobacteraceae bacterium]|nr:hypothetical protein [Hymenobacteraceae bacterium]MDX5395399.1 hypothetical protein [Hymenobacteraceae bacterium]MDX5444031.1 hypothetical protein [Hymenobacteraceae bacterium]MDX5511448.1 hypothetical protein [Hymenobacteraceae bacterium]